MAIFRNFFGQNANVTPPIIRDMRVSRQMKIWIPKDLLTLMPLIIGGNISVFAEKMPFFEIN